MTKDAGVSLKALLDKVATLEAQLAASKRGRFGIKLGNKGNICITGLQRYPFSFYRTQIEAILDNADNIRKFIKDNEKALSTKSED